MTTLKRLIPRTSKTPGSRRSGAFMIVAMICLLLTSALLGTLLKMAVFGRQQSKIEAAGLQAEWLAESALDRAAARLASNSGYKGETWKISAEELGGQHAGEVAIAVKPASAENRLIVEVVARYPVAGPHSVQRSKRLAVGADSPPPAGDSQNDAPASAEKIGRGGEGEIGR